MTEKDVHFTSDGVDLAGTLAMAEGPGPVPGVLLLPGSGEVDRDGNHKKLPMNMLREIADFLAQGGVASYRYDKRGVGQSGGDYWSTGFYDHVTDAEAALDLLRRQEGILPENVFVLGHSEGALISIRLAGTGVALSGAILLSGASQSGEAILKWQALQIVKGLEGFSGWLARTLRIDVAKTQQKKLDKIRNSTEDVLHPAPFVKLNAKWFREFMAFDPAEDLARTTIPLLAITGSKDIQVDPADLDRMAELVKGPFERHLIPNMTHMLRTQEGTASASKYREEVKRPTEPEVLELSLRWIEGQMADG